MANLVALTSFGPDLDPITPGVVTDGNDFYPSLVGFRTLPDLLQVTQPLPARCRGAAAFTFGDGTQWIVAGCCDDGGGNVSLNAVRATDLSAVAPAAWATEPLFDGAAVGRWRFDIYQNVGDANSEQGIIAVDGVHPPLVATWGRLHIDPSSAWWVLGGNPPIASHVAASDFYLFLVGELQADIINAPLPVVTNHWWASARSDTWTQNVADLSVAGYLSQTSGPITALLALRSMMAAYKANATYLGQLTQPPDIWDFSEVSRQTGAQGQEGVLAVRDTHTIVGPDDFFTFDGFSLTPVPNALRRWFTERVSRVGRAAAQARFDQSRSLGFIHYTTRDAVDQSLLNEWVALNFVTSQWATGQLLIQAAISQPLQFGPQTTSGLIRADGALWLYARDGQRTQPGASLTTGDLGDRRSIFETQPIRPGFSILNGVPTLTALTTYVGGRPYTVGNTVPLQADGVFNLQTAARLQRLKLSSSADVEIANLDVPLVQQGDA